jgi:dimethylaniline monooxygenase (N-oxide forming)
MMLLRRELSAATRGERCYNSSFSRRSRAVVKLQRTVLIAAPATSYSTSTTALSSSPSLLSNNEALFHIPRTQDAVLLGCVSYDPAVGAIWNQMKQHFRDNDKVPTFDYVLFTNYELQVRALLDSHIDVAWNGPLAHVLAEHMVMSKNDDEHMVMSKNDDEHIVSLGMRDVDCDFESIIVLRKDLTRGLRRETRLLAGDADSPQACVVPRYALHDMYGIACSIDPQNSVDVGKHGDTALGEIIAMQKLLGDGGDFYDGALLSRMMWDRAIAGQIDTVNGKKLAELYYVYSDSPDNHANIKIPKFDHCQFDALASTVATGKLDAFYMALHAMDYNDPVQQRIMKLEGIRKSWSEPRQEGYDIVRAAMKKQLRGGGGASGVSIRPAQNYQQTTRMHNRAFSTTNTTAAVEAAAAAARLEISGIHHYDKPLDPAKSRIGIIGCGVAGLQVIRSLRAHGFQHVTAFDQASDVGGLWRENYDGYALQVGKQFFEMPDCEMTEAEWQELASGPTVQSYIKRFASKFHLMDHVQLNTGIERVVRNANSENDDGEWTFHTTTGEQHVFDYCVISTGMYSSCPFVPTNISGRDDFCSASGGSIIHSSEFRNAQVFSNGKNVVVVGGGKSATDCSTAAAEAGAKSVTMLQRNAHWPTPLYIAGLIPFQHVFLSRLGQALVEAKVGVYPNSPSTTASYFRPVMGPIFAVVEALFAFQLGLKGDLRPKSGVVEDFYGYAQVQDGSFKAMRDSGKVQVQLGQIDRFTTNGVQVKGKVIPAELVVFATGFSKDYSKIFEPDVMKQLSIQKDGLCLYRHILPPSVPGLAFVGSECATIFNVTSSGLQAEWLARLLSGHEAMKQTASLGEKAMEHEAQALQTFARSFMPETSSRSSLVLLHQLHYYDQLLTDMGENPSRKSNPVAEYLGSYYCRDYNDIVGRLGSSK